MARREATDDELMGAVAQGDREAFGVLLRRHRTRVYRLVRAFVRDHELAEDTVQEVFCRVYQHAGSYQAQDTFHAWLKRIAVNLAKNAIRSRRRSGTVPLEEAGVAEESPFDPVAALMVEGLREEVRSALQALPEEQRLALIMRYFGDMSVADIAWALRCPEGTIKSRLSNGLRKVREALTTQWHEEREDEDV